MTAEMELCVDANGGVKCIYDEMLDLRELGRLTITRASHVEPDAEGCWFADMGPVGGAVLGPFRSRSEALAAERGWLQRSTSLTQPISNSRRSASPANRIYHGSAS
jgi:hypothetical protein